MVKQTTLHDVAAHCGVSYQTVSRVINGKGRVTEETRRRVLLSARELGYRPNALARSLVAGRSRTIGVVTTELYRFAPSRFATGIQQRCQELGYLLLMCWLGAPDDPAQYLDKLAARQVDAIIWMAPEMVDGMGWASSDALTGLPPVVFCDVRPNPGLHVVCTDNRQAAANATRHLLERQRDPVGMITGPLERIIASDRLAGWEDAMREAGLDPDPTLVAVGDWSSASGEAALRELLHRRPDLGAVLASNDRMALGALHAAFDAGKRVPDELMIAGIDNIPEAAYFIPPLTTVQQPLGEMGRAAVDLALKLAEARWSGSSEPSETTLVLPSELVVRASSTRI